MVNAMPEDHAHASAEQLARFMMVCAREDPALLRRQPVPPADDFLSRIRGLSSIFYRQPSDARPPGPGFDPYLEELVSLAVASARRAEDASHEAFKAGRTARRGMFAVGLLAAVGVTAGALGLTVGIAARQTADAIAFRMPRVSAAEAALDAVRLRFAEPAVPPAGNAPSGEAHDPKPLRQSQATIPGDSPARDRPTSDHPTADRPVLAPPATTAPAAAATDTGPDGRHDDNAGKAPMEVASADPGRTADRAVPAPSQAAAIDASADTTPPAPAKLEALSIAPWPVPPGATLLTRAPTGQDRWPPQHRPAAYRSWPRLRPVPVAQPTPRPFARFFGQLRWNVHVLFR